MNRATIPVLCIAVITTAIAVALAGGIVFFFYGQHVREREKNAREKPLNCYVCHSTKNFGRVYRDTNLRMFYSRRVRENGDDEIPTTSVEECLNNPTQTQECKKGEYCAVIHMKLNEIQRVDRKCFKGSRPGCNSKIVEGILEKACFCASDKCKQIPDWSSVFMEERVRRFNERLTPRQVWEFQKNRGPLLS